MYYSNQQVQFMMQWDPVSGFSFGRYTLTTATTAHCDTISLWIRSIAVSESPRWPSTDLMRPHDDPWAAGLRAAQIVCQSAPKPPSAVLLFISSTCTKSIEIFLYRALLEPNHLFKPQTFAVVPVNTGDFATWNLFPPTPWAVSDRNIAPSDGS